MKFPLFLLRVDVGELEEVREKLEAILDKILRRLPYNQSQIFGDLMEVIDFIPDNSDEVSHRGEVILSIGVDLLGLSNSDKYKGRMEFFDPWDGDHFIVLGVRLKLANL